ncbi:hypothetical protein DT076_09305 [Desertihabitans brevis]|uniref:Uncharacterized protein n=1 Tax=Desertihabitans brevis TaxID=2268447 RepID=A0A367YV66_9ACTN|nr:hypothetical protein [Desertihabitans brevis]RCK69647.1 hypothetical protein DT076_09305 [Desertihabitans brevis]
MKPRSEGDPAPDGAGPDSGTPWFSDTFAGALRARGWTLTALRRQLVERGNPVSLSTLSYWRSGQRVPEGADSRLVVRDIEEILGLEPDELQRSVPPSRRLGPRGPARADRLLARDGVPEIFAELGLDDLMNGLYVEWLHRWVDIGPDGAPTAFGNRGLYRAGRPGIERLAEMYVALSQDSDPFATIETIGCSLGRVIRRPEAKVSVAELLLPRPLHLGEEVMLEWTMRPQHAVPAQRFECYTEQRNQEILASVRFHPDRLPAWVERYTDSEGGSELYPAQVDGFTVVHHRQRNFGPGTLGVRWGY